MYRRHTIDKFGHALLDYPQPMEVDDDEDDSKKRGSTNNEYLEKNYFSKVDIETMLAKLSQDMREYVDRVCMKLSSDGKVWDGKNLSISKVADGSHLTDVVTIGQMRSAQRHVSIDPTNLESDDLDDERRRTKRI